MNIAPWKKRNGELSSSPELEDFWKGFVDLTGLSGPGCRRSSKAVTSRR